MQRYVAFVLETSLIIKSICELECVKGSALEYVETRVDCQNQLPESSGF